ncbi:uncharacterized protein LOC123317979 [Coccinella septempunctata]|uniref:uncharacterized protein LOC123317979 n=1 Tax=Coccinella septempunctata TaxID=41139 RepID=UPI001D06DC08|nr:uncharacterized protein LOC123317979 [Coccinella septempunctata]
MPKRAHSSHRKKDAQMRKLKKKLKQMEKQIRKIQSSESSESDHTYSKEESSDSESSDNESYKQKDDMEIEAPTPTQDFSVLGSKPNDEDEMGKSLHEEIIVRWNTYLQKGFDKTQREELMAKYKLPVNCKMLIPPLVNKEILPCLPKSANENDHFLKALQKQLAHGLTALTENTRLFPI